MNSPQSSDLAALGVPRATARVVTYFALNPSARPTVRELLRTLGIASASAQRDIQRLVAAGALKATLDGRLLRYAPQADSPIWAAARILAGGVIPVAGRAKAVRERATAYGVDLTQLRSNLELTQEERILQLDENASFLAAARANRDESSRKKRR